MLYFVSVEAVAHNSSKQRDEHSYCAGPLCVCVLMRSGKQERTSESLVDGEASRSGAREGNLATAPDLLDIFYTSTSPHLFMIHVRTYIMSVVVS